MLLMQHPQSHPGAWQQGVPHLMQATRARPAQPVQEGLQLARRHLCLLRTAPTGWRKTPAMT